mgnify:CR=1 FL=1
MQLYELARGLLTDPLFWVVLMFAAGFLAMRRRPVAAQ